MPRQLETAPPIPQRIVLYDGVCGLCDRVVSWLIAHDRGAFDYAPLQGPTAARLRERHPNIPATLESVVFVDGDRAHLRAAAFTALAAYLPYPWRIATYARWAPTFLLDAAYRWIAARRYRWWGTRDACRLPADSERNRLLP